MIADDYASGKIETSFGLKLKDLGRGWNHRPKILARGDGLLSQPDDHPSPGIRIIGRPLNRDVVITHDRRVFRKTPP